MTRKALITWGGWGGHEPQKVAGLFERILDANGMVVEVHNTLDCLCDPDLLAGLDLIVPVWTMSKIEDQLAINVSEAVARGTGLAGCHGGMCDAFRENVLWQFMTGGNWVAHPGNDGTEYMVNITDPDDPLSEGIEDFEVLSEHYYLHVDPAVRVLATTEFPNFHWYHSANGSVEMPVAWTKRWGLGRVYYNALGHNASVIDNGPAYEMISRGLLWASKGREASLAEGERFEDYFVEGKVQ